MRDADGLSYGMPYWQIAIEAASNIRSLGKKALLALLGIAVGSGAVVALLNIGQSAQTESMSVFRGMGSDLLVASIQLPVGSRAAHGASTTNLDIPSMVSGVNGIKSAAALIPTSSEIKIDGKTFSPMIVGASTSLKEVLNLIPENGRLLHDFDELNTYVVVGANLAKQLHSENVNIKTESLVQVNGYLFEVVGILKPYGNNPLVPVSIDDVMLAPLKSMRRITSSPLVSSVMVRTSEKLSITEVPTKLKEWIAKKLPEFVVNIQVPQQLIEGIEKQSRTFSLLISGMAGVSLLLGGIGVMNVMVMSVTERRKEIGVRMAVGARPKDIALLFLIEAILLSTAGALFGSATGQLFSWIYVGFTGWAEFSQSPVAIPLGLGSAILVGLFFGLAPAITASKLQPFYALRDV